ncbi:sigma-54 dependent transcriptional regulator [Sphingosinicella sp. LHD-64]|uniref:sigma-54 interaction domain-containing protein n=1 Tax=Sphingosinicella sp. LHD-64 TaxID=3072139 RepID=UPI0028103ACF|nr:sigma-54 dependent transcriptional regulator [Sphingosinicella sp. LHD-64]MDQ8757151.1 sigma-54 dependent transcriptional regulator [Sphingosinicella sp. LHD-64]
MVTLAAAAPEAMIVGDSAVIAELRRLVACVAPSGASVLLAGPSGSGKEVVARAIHAASGRGDKPFVAVNCGAIPRDLLESELFGHEKGAFTGAHAQHKGRFEEADGGTLFLDEIGDMPADMQVKLLRVLEERAVQRVGGRGQIAVDVRIVAATHRDIDAAIDAGKFREDLFYRLAVFPIEIPSLAERRSDVPQLIRHFVKAMGKRAGDLQFSEAAFERLAEHGWPGNVRELRNFVERAAILFAGRTIGPAEAGSLLLRRGRVGAVERSALWEATERLHAAFATEEDDEDAGSVQTEAEIVPIRAEIDISANRGLNRGEPVALRDMLADIERRYIEEALTLSDGVIADAARLLSLQRTTLIEKMRKYEMKAA